MDDKHSPLLSICCLAYNQEKFIKKTLDGFLMQKTEFPIEIIINDDASMDKTPEIIREYQKKYPDIIKPIFQSVNQYSKGTRLLLLVFQAAKGEYIAYCEGDDYWIDKYKLQKQVEFLKSHPECSICGHNVRNYHETEHKFGRIAPPRQKPEISDLKYLVGDNFIPSLSILFRKSAFQNPPDVYYQVPFEDLIFKIICAQHGKIGFLNEVMGVYRIHQNSMTLKNKFAFTRKKIRNIELITEYLDQYKNLRYKIIKNRVFVALSLLNNHDITGYKNYITYLLSKSHDSREFLYIQFLIQPWNIAWFLNKFKPNFLEFFNIIYFFLIR